MLPYCAMSPVFLVAALLLGQMSASEWDKLIARYQCGKKEADKACAARLHAALVKELARPKPLPMSSEGCENPPKPGACIAGYSGCMPLAVFIAHKLMQVGREAAVALPQLKTLEQRWPEFASVAQDVRSVIGVPEVLAVADEQLASPVGTCRFHGIQLLRQLDTPESAVHLAAFAKSGPWSDRAQATAYLAPLGEKAVPGLLAVLDDTQPVPNLVAALDSLGMIGPPARPALERVAALAGSHWSSEVRAEAERAARRMGEKAVFAGSRACARADAGSRAKELPRPKDACTARSPVALTVDGVCIVGAAGRDEGGVLEADGVEVVSEWYSVPRHLLALNGHVYVLQDRRAGERSSGEIVELLHGPKGWRVEFVTSLPGAIEAVWLDAAGRLMLQTTDAACRSGALVRFLDAERRIQVLE
jgi:hypothetical protein